MPLLEDSLRRLKSRFRSEHRKSHSLSTSNGTNRTNGMNASSSSLTTDSNGSERNAKISMQADVEHVAAMSMPIPQIIVESPKAKEYEDHVDVVKDMATSGVYDKVLAGPSTSKTGKLNQVVDAVDVVFDAAAAVADAAQPAQDFLSSKFMATVEAKVNSFAEDIPWLMNVLDEVTALHPVITVVVLAFKAAYHIEMTRRENDKRIKALYVEMKEMIHVLIHLKDVKDPEARDPRGKPLSDRLGYLSQKAAADIKDCANVCDTFARKGPLIRALKGAVWEGRLVAFIKRFDKRRSEFEEALAIHTAWVVDSIALTIGSMEAKIDLITKLFKQYIPANERKLSKIIEEKGKDARSIQNSEKDLRDLLDQEYKLDSNAPSADTTKTGDQKSGRGNDRGMRRPPLTVKELREELHEDLDEGIRKNLLTFEGKFMLYHRQMHEGLLKVLQENHSQLLVAVQGGPHERIKDRELRKIWHDMNWRRNVKARLFVMTLRDNFQDKLLEMKLIAREAKLHNIMQNESKISLATQPKPIEQGDRLNEENIPPAVDEDAVDHARDDWAYHYISLAWLQPIMEAFDDDGSGYITVTEINRFTDGKPKELRWTLQHWIAYWAVGWQISAWHYRKQILDLFATLFDILPRLHLENRFWADYYLGKVWPYAAELLMALRGDDLPDLQHKFQPYMDLEERRIKRNLEDIKYNIDSRDLVYRVGGERIEKHVLPLVYLLLKRDLEIFRVAQYKVIHKDELWDATENLLCVFDAVVLRVTDLTNLFIQQQVDVVSRMDVMAAGLLRHYYDHSKIWSMTNLWSLQFNYLEGEPQPVPDDYDASASESLLQYALPGNCTMADISVFDQGFEWDVKPPTTMDLEASYPLADILGQWTGYLYDNDDFPSQVMRDLDMHATSLGDRTFEADGRDFHGTVCHLAGNCSANDRHEIEVKFAISFANSRDQEYFEGRIVGSGALVGYMSWSENVMDTWRQQFIFRQLPADIMAYHPSPQEMAANPSRARWQFAIQSTLHTVRKRRWSWSYFSERQKNRKRYIDLNIAYWTYGRRPVGEEYAEFVQRYRSLTPSEACFYRSIRDHLLDVIPRHDNVTCATCGGQLGGPRVLCLDCQPEEQQFWQTMDFCHHETCNYTVIGNEIYSFLEPGKPHRPTHDLMKLCTILHRRDMPDLDRKAKAALSHARSVWTQAPVIPLTPSISRHSSILNLSGSKRNHVSTESSRTPSEDLTEEFRKREDAQSNCVDEVGLSSALGSNGLQNRLATSSNALARTDLNDVLTLAVNVPLPESPASSVASHLHVEVASAPSQPLSPMTAPPVPQCSTCSKGLTGPCWFCVTCYQSGGDLFICDQCEADCLLPCVECKRPYTQPRYYYGSDPNTFLCNVCTIKGVLPSEISKESQHVCTHPLVRVQDRIEDPVPALPPSTDERIATLEERVSAIDDKLDRLEYRLQELMLSQDRLEGHLSDAFCDKFSQMEQLLIQILASSTGRREISECAGVSS
ncbi:unnamed protein product [Somion occarium]|uniref:EF-hand domain-containing protein n=1 Tax=Somion occarium TaxID=3059160 RepID=A0ABP1DS49_9APHY